MPGCSWARSTAGVRRSGRTTTGRMIHRRSRSRKPQSSAIGAWLAHSAIAVVAHGSSGPNSTPSLLQQAPAHCRLRGPISATPYRSTPRRRCGWCALGKMTFQQSLVLGTKYYRGKTRCGYGFCTASSQPIDVAGGTGPTCLGSILCRCCTVPAIFGSPFSRGPIPGCRLVMWAFELVAGRVLLAAFTWLLAITTCKRWGRR